MAGGVVVVGLVVATISSWVVERASRGHDDAVPASRADMRALTAELRKAADASRRKRVVPRPRRAPAHREPLRTRRPQPVAPAPAVPVLSPTLRVPLWVSPPPSSRSPGLFFARELVGPLVLAAVIVIICHPVRHPLERWGWPRWAATTGVIVVAYLILLVLGALLFFAGTQFVRLVGDYSDELQASAQSVIAWLGSIGLDEQASDAAASALEPSTIVSFFASLGGTAIGILTALFFVFAYVIFMAADGSRYARAGTSFGSVAQPTVRRFQVFNSSVRRYYVVNASFGAVVAIIDGLALWALGVPAPAVWAILAFVTNFIPNIGFVIGLIPPALLALVVGGLPLMLAVVAIYCVVNVDAAGARAAEVRQRRGEPQPHAELLLGDLLDLRHRPARRDPLDSADPAGARSRARGGSGRALAALAVGGHDHRSARPARRRRVALTDSPSWHEAPEAAAAISFGHVRPFCARRP